MRKIVSPPPTQLKDKHGAYLPEDPVPTPKNTRSLSLGQILERQVLALERTSIELLKASASGMNKDQIQSLATCIKITMELKIKENEMLDALDDSELEAIADADNE